MKRGAMLASVDAGGTAPQTMNHSSCGYARGALQAALAVTLSIFLAATPVAAQVAGTATARLDHLLPLVGTYDFEAVLADPAVAGAIQRLMGPLAEQLPHNLRVRVSVDYVGGALVLTGQAPREEGAEEAASVWVKVSTGYVAVVLLHEGQVTVFTEAGDILPWSKTFRSTISDIATYAMDIDLPDGLVWIHGGEQGDPPGGP